MNRKNITGVLSVILTVLLLVFAYRYISNMISQIDRDTLEVNWALVGLSGLLFTVFYGVMSVHWHMATKIVDPEVPKNQSLAFFASQPYKYLPTSLFTFSFRAVYAKKVGLSFKKSSVAQVFENGMMLAANFSVFMIVYSLHVNKIVTGLLVLVAILGLMLIWGRRELHLRLKGRELHVSTVHLLKMFCVAFTGWLISGAAFVTLNHALHLPVDVIDYLAANSLAFSLGLLAFFAPGGIGIRELVYNYFGVNPAAIIYWRILTFVLDFVLGAWAIWRIKSIRS
jgi:hypothetical protein